MKFSDDLIVCPHCGKEFVVNHDDMEEFGEDMSFKQMCPHCDETVVIKPVVSVEYEVHKFEEKECSHEWKFVEAFPEWDSYMECKKCGKVRELTSEEKKHFNIPEKKYFYDR